MRIVLAIFFLVVSLPAHAASVIFDLRFEKDFVLELQTGFDPGARCLYNDACYPGGFRLADGQFAGLNPGDQVKARIDTVTREAFIDGWRVEGDATPRAGALAYFLSLVPIGYTEFTTDKVIYNSEGPLSANASGLCDPSRQAPNLPTGFCGFYGYQAEFAVEGISAVPLPAGALLLLSGLGAFVLARKRHG